MVSKCVVWHFSGSLAIFVGEVLLGDFFSYLLLVLCISIAKCQGGVLVRPTNSDDPFSNWVRGRIRIWCDFNCLSTSIKVEFAGFLLAWFVRINYILNAYWDDGMCGLCFITNSYFLLIYNYVLSVLLFVARYLRCRTWRGTVQLYSLNQNGILNVLYYHLGCSDSKIVAQVCVL